MLTSVRPVSFVSGVLSGGLVRLLITSRKVTAHALSKTEESMWTERERRYGGRQQRYKGFPQATLRCLDPLRRRPVSFATDLHYQNWLLPWAMPLIADLTLRGEILTFLDSRQIRSLTPDLRFSSDGVEIQL